MELVLGFTLYSFNTLLIQLGKFDMIGVAQDVYTNMLNSGIRPSLMKQFQYNSHPKCAHP